ncbi:TPA: VCBS domain-containing protein, partial [Vibrio vulnificus]
TVTSVDGTPSTIKVTINGTNDAATVSSATVAVDETDKAVTTSGTLTSTDVDNPDNAFTPDSITGTHGNLTIDAHGHWVFTANSAFNQLNVGDKVEETFTVTSVDGTPSTIKVTINGTNDRPTISGTSSGSVIEQGLNTAGTPDATGSLIATDLDKSDTITWAINQPQGQWGTLSIDQHGHWHYQLDNSTGGAADKLAAGEHQSESFWITATDSAGATVPHKIVIDVQGSNDKPIVSAWTQLPAGKEDQPVTIKASDLLTHASDVDSGDVLHVTNLQATHGSLTDNKDGTYTFTPDKDFNGEIRLTYDVVDGHGGSVSTQAKFDLTAAPDNAIITDAQTNTDLRGVTEDRGYIDTHYQLHYDGRLNIQDPDTGEAHFDPNIGPQTYQGIGYDTKLGGHILLMRDGHYTYTLDNRNIQDLAQGEVKHDSAVIRSADGTTHTIELTVHGTNDAPIINAQSHSVTEDGQLLTGQMQGHDIDHGATLTYSIAQAVDGLTFNPDGSYSFDPSHPSYQSLVQGQTQTLTVPVTVTDEHGASATQNLEIMVTGSNDGAQISGTDTGDVYESTYTDRSPDYQRGNIAHLWNNHIHTSGKLDIVDSDAGEAHFDNNAPAYQYFGQYGRLILQPDGNWYYRVDVGDSAIGRKIDALNTGENLTDTITIRSADGTTHDVVITIHGDNDSPFASGEVQLNSGKEDNAQTITEAQLLANSMDVDTSDAGKLHVDNLQVDHGSIRDNQDGTYTFTPEKDYNGEVHFTYDVKDAHSGVTHTGATMHLVPVGDAATISGTDSGSITEDRHVFPDSMHHIQVTGSLSISDPDAGEDHFRASGAFGHEKAISDPFQGEMHIDRYGNWDYVLANGNPALQALKQGETKDVIYEVHSADGTPHRITITVKGTNDAPTLTAQTHNVTEDGQRLSGQMLGHDIDHGAVLTYSISHPIDGLTFHSDGSYSFNPSHSSYQHLADGQQQTVTVPITVTDEHGDSATELLVFTVTGTNDAPVVSPITDSVTEDSDKHHQLDLLQGAKDVEGDGLSIGQIQCTYNGQTGALPAGVRFAPDGHTLVVDATDSNFQHLAAGEKETIVFHYQVIDSHGAATAQTATITVVGTDDKAQLVTSNIDLTEGEALKTYQHISDVSGHLSLTDPDSHDSTHFEFNIVQGSQNVGVLTIWPDGQYRYYVDPARNHNAHYAVNSLKSGETLTEHFQVKTSDGQTKDIAVTIHGEDNQAHLQVVDPKLLPVDPDLYEDKTSFSDPNKLYAGGIVRVHDPDHDEAQAVAHTETSAHGGHFQVGSSGGWSYTIDNNSPQVQNLGAGESFTDSFTIRSKDGSASQVISVTVHGTNDNPIVTSQVQLPSSTEDHTSTITVAQLLANSSDIDTNDAGQLSIANLVADHGSIKDNQDGTFTFTPDKDYNGQVHFTYDVKDAHGGLAHTGATMILAPQDDAAQISGVDTGDVYESAYTDRSPDYQRGNISHLWNDQIHTSGKLDIVDSDAGEAHFDNNAPAYQYFGQYGRLIMQSDGNWYYHVDVGDSAVGRKIDALNSGESLTDTITIRSADGTTHDVVITIHGDNDSPFVSHEVQLNSGKEDNTQTITEAQLLANSMDVDASDTGKLRVVSLQVDHGSIRDNQDGTYTFTPTKDYNGQVHFTYDVKDAHGGVAHTGATLDLAAVDDKTVISGVSQGAATEDVGTPMATHVTLMDAVDWQALQITDVDSANTQVTVEFAGQRYTWDLGRDLDIMTPYGKFQFHTITSGPHTGEHAWSYIGDNNNIHVQELKHGESLTESIKLIATDGTEFPISVTVNGTEDGVVIDSKSELGHVIEDSQTVVSGSVTAHDTDLHDTVGWTQTPTGGVPGHYGTFHLSSDGQWHYDLDQSKAEQLGDGDEYWEHFTVEAISTDGSRVSKSVSVVVHGSNDAPTVSGEVTLPSGKEDTSIPITQAQLIANATDTDLNDRGWLHAQNLTADHGSITSNSDGSFTFKPDPNYHGAVHFSYDIADRHGGVTHTGANLTLTPENDPSVLVGTGQATLTEDHTQGSSSTLWSGWLQLDTQDPDGPSDGKIVGIEVNGVVHQVPADFALTLRTHLGYFSTTHSTDGHNKWSYSADNSNPEIQGLKAGEQLHESMTLITADGTRIPITATINGEEDHVVIDTPVATLASLGTAIEDTTTRIVGQLQAHDVDIHDSVSYVQTSLVGKYGTFHLDSNGAWHYDLDHSRANHLAAGEMKAEGFDITATSSDGSQVSQHIELYVQGSNDAPQVTEVNQGTAPLGSHSINEDGSASVQGQILITDVDHSDQHSVVVDAHNQPQYGHVSYDTQTNTWTYVLDNANPTVNALNSGDDLTDKFSLIVDDGHGGSATKEIEMTIHGHSDTPPTPTLVAPAQITGSAGHQDLHASLGIPPLIHQAVPHMQTGWGILTGGGHVVSSLQGQFGTLHVNAQTGELTYDYQTSSGVIKTHTGGSYGSGTDETDSFILTLAGTQNSQVSVHLHLHSQSVHGASGHHIDQTTLTGIDVSPLNAPPPPPPVASDEISPITPENDNVEVAGVDVYLHALGITSLTDQDAHDTQQQSPQDLDIVLSDPAHDPNSLNPEVGNHQIDITEQPDHDLDDINPDDHHNHNDPTSFIDPN